MPQSPGIACTGPVGQRSTRGELCDVRATLRNYQRVIKQHREGREKESADETESTRSGARYVERKGECAYACLYGCVHVHISIHISVESAFPISPRRVERLSAVDRREQML